MGSETKVLYKAIEELTPFEVAILGKKIFLILLEIKSFF